MFTIQPNLWYVHVNNLCSMVPQCGTSVKLAEYSNLAGDSPKKVKNKVQMMDLSQKNIVGAKMKRRF